MNKVDLVDKRVYAIDYPKTNIVINTVSDYLNKKNTKFDVLTILENLLKQCRDDTINIAINLSPSFEISNIIWDILSTIISYKNNILLIPIITVLGAQEDLKFKLNFDNDQMKHLLNDNNIFSSNIDVIGNLCHNLNSLKFSELYHLDDNLVTQNFEEYSLIKKGQDIKLNYIIIKIDNLQDNINYDLNKYIKIKTKIATLLNGVQNKNLVTYTIPFEPISVLNAFKMGAVYYNDVRLHVEISDVVKKIRQNGSEPFITVENDEDLIKLSINSNVISTTIDWKLSLIDDFSLILDKINDLLIDLQVEYAIK